MTTAVIGKTEVHARRGYSPKPGETVRFIAEADFNALSDDERSGFAEIIALVMIASEDKKKTPKK